MFQKMFKNFNIPVMRIIEDEKENGAKYLQRQ